MKNVKRSFRQFVVLLILVALFAACKDNTREYVTYKANVPEYMSFSDFRSSFAKSAPEEITNPGKMYFKDNYLFVNEYEKGIHVIDNSDPVNPKKVAFYKILGNVDMAIRDNILYADSYIDLVAIDISDILNPVEKGRLKNVFPEIMPVGELYYPYSSVDKSKGVIVGWHVKTITEDREDGWYNSRKYYADFAALNSASSASGGMSQGAGVAGSMARFMLNDKYLYVISVPWRLKTVDVSVPAELVVKDSIDIPRSMETLFRLGNKMFIGTTTGMLIYDLADPVKPSQVSSYDHIKACDPVVADGKYAYVTLRSGTTCMNNNNLLEVIDISSISNPYLVKSYPMFNPHGLGVDGDLLFVCDGSAGLKVYDKSDPLMVLNNQIAHYPDFDTYDVIPNKKVLMLVGKDGIYQYDYSNVKNIKQISYLKIVEKK
jgi:hypothetical protein